MDFIKKPKDIEDKSMKIIMPYVEGLGLTADEIRVYSRMIHASGDVEYANLVRTSPNAVKHGIDALKRGATIFTDVEMVRTGINKRAMANLGCSAQCLIRDEEVAKNAKELGITRSMAAMRKFGTSLDGGVIAIGNAPTALYEVLRMIEEEKINPALIVGIPVGFVGAAESKEYLIENATVPYITVKGNKGGSSIAAAVVNALLYASVNRDEMLFVTGKK